MFLREKNKQPCEILRKVDTGHFYRQMAVCIELGLNVTEQVEGRWRGAELRVLIRACFSRSEIVSPSNCAKKAS